MHDSSKGRRVSRKGRRLALAAIASLCLLISTTTSDASWPQWGGEHRNFTVSKAKIASRWPDTGPTKLWSRPLGDGFSCIVSDGRTLYTMFRANDANETVIALDAATGQTRWEHKYPAPYIDEGGDKKQDTQFGKGPNSTPLLHDGRLYTIGFSCIMHCLDVKTGKPLWSHDLYKEFGGSLPMFGYSASPIGFRDLVIAPVGGKAQGLMAFDAATGKVRWHNYDGDASYSSPILVRSHGRNHLVAYLGTHICGFNAANGDVQWRLTHKNPSNENSICTPIDCGDGRVYFVNFGDTAGGRMIRLIEKKDLLGTEEIWANKKLAGGISDAVRIGRTFYATNGKGILAAFNVKTGEILWEERGYPGVKLLVAGKRLILLDEDGKLSLARPGAKGLEVISKTQVLAKPTWSAPTLDGGVLYLRDRKSIMALDVR